MTTVYTNLKANLEIRTQKHRHTHRHTHTMTLKADPIDIIQSPSPALLFLKVCNFYEEHTNWRPGSQTHESVSDSWHLDRSSRVENALLMHVILKVSSHKVARTSPVMWGFVMMFWFSLVSSGLCAKNFGYFGTSED